MLNMKNIYAGTEVAAEFKTKLKELFMEYAEKIQAVCPEDTISHCANYDFEISQIARLQLYGIDGSVTKQELEENGFIVTQEDENETMYYSKSVNGIKVTCTVKSDAGGAKCR